MYKNTNDSSAKLGKATLPGLLASLLFLAFAAGPALADSPEHEFEEAEKYMDKGYAALGKVADATSDKSAYRHLNKALKEFSDAEVHLAKADLPASDKPAIDAMKKGLTALQKCVKALEKNDMSKAEQECDATEDYFAEASALLD